MNSKNLAKLCLLASVLSLLSLGWCSPVSAQGTTWKMAVLIYKNAELDFPGETIPISNWQAEYFNNKNLSGTPALTRTDEKIDFDWKGARPFSQINAENFSARWTNSFNLSAARDLYFDADVDDGTRVYLDNSLIIDQWKDQIDHFYKITNVAAGSHQLKVEYFQGGGGSYLHFLVAPANHVSFQMTDSEIDLARQAVAKIPPKILSWSNNLVTIIPAISVIERPISTVGNPVKKGWWWTSPVTTKTELDSLSGQSFDSVLIFWPSRVGNFCDYIGVCSWGFALKPMDWTRGMTYAVYQGIARNEANFENSLIHEWLHGVTGFFTDHGFNPQPGLDDGEKYGYGPTRDPDGSRFYTDIMRKRVLDPQTGNYIGIGEDAWLTIKPNNVRSPDIDGNGTVGESDRVWLNGCYDPLGSPGNEHCRKADLNNSNVVNALDYSLLLKNWSL